MVPRRGADRRLPALRRQTLARLAFIARAKQLGCTLEEIADLVEVWNGDRCGPVQRQLHELVTAKFRDADLHIAELNRFTGQLPSPQPAQRRPGRRALRR